MRSRGNWLVGSHVLQFMIFRQSVNGGMVMVPCAHRCSCFVTSHINISQLHSMRSKKLKTHTRLVYPDIINQNQSLRYNDYSLKVNEYSDIIVWVGSFRLLVKSTKSWIFLRSPTFLLMNYLNFFVKYFLSTLYT